MRATRATPPPRVVREAETYVRKHSCTWRTALALLRVTEAEDARWRGDAEDAEDRGDLDPASPLGRWLALNREGRESIAEASGRILTAIKSGATGPQITAAKAVLEVEAVDAWGKRDAAEAAQVEEETRTDLAKWDAAHEAQRGLLARLAERAREDLSAALEVDRQLRAQARQKAS